MYKNGNGTLSDALQGQSNIPVPAQRAQFLQPSPGIQSAAFQQSKVNAAELPQGLCFLQLKIRLIADDK